MKNVVLKKGIDLPLGGAPEQKIYASGTVSRYAVIGDDHVGLKPSMNVQEGDSVKPGDLLFTDKKNAGVKFVSPFAGRVLAVNRGEKRRFLSLEIEIEDTEGGGFKAFNTAELKIIGSDTVRNAVNDAGLWTSFISRPFGKTPAADASADYIYVTAADTRPLCADVKTAIEGGRSFLQLVSASLRSWQARSFMSVSVLRILFPRFRAGRLSMCALKGRTRQGLRELIFTFSHLLTPETAHGK